MGESNISGVT